MPEAIDEKFEQELYLRSEVDELVDDVRFASYRAERLGKTSVLRALKSAESDLLDAQAKLEG